MKIRKLNQFFSFGYSVAVLHRARRGDSKEFLIESAESCREGLVEEGFRVSLRVFEKTVGVSIESIKKGKEKEITEHQARDLSDNVEKVVLTINAELEDIPAFSVAEKRYDFRKLFEEIPKLFKSNAFKKLPELARFDFSEAGKCILFERSTASAFHALRATEAVLGAFHVKLIGPVPDKSTWGSLETALKNHTPAVDLAITGQIEHIRKRFRNKTQHPDLRFDIDEAQDLLNVCIDLCNRLSDEL
ncbi:hypothetical protein [Variovorax arabinosiphilus]|uniref:hypothetical protein n=1 Tax=Variovorax arabinosiphilus TaxID=3053498 RepID=UPI002575B924|nr:MULTISPECIES: hypothetical protein [unclassified Variovorax]MDM0119879.1 hypothetical protein [Variovorax sp. J2L1-78]MDM0231909.1 hypothetical protein [Variovorax sp. J2R1-6]